MNEEQTMKAEVTYEYLKDKVHEQSLIIANLNNDATHLLELHKKTLEENERLNNIINELEKVLDLNLPFKVVGVRHLKNKLQELKGEDKE